MFTIETISNRVVKGTKLVTETSFIIVDASGELVSGTKDYATREEAQAKIDGLGNLAEGLAFAQAQFPGMADKAQLGKANVVAAYLDWIAAGKPVKTVEESQAEPEAETAEPAPAAPVTEAEEY
uniref:Uncharacterized protein n=1 Tax=Klebsiella phage vB_KpnP_PYH-2 TaxID=3116870 RepID=A0AAU6NU63_9CAUD